MFSMMGMGSSKVTPEHHKDFRKLETALVKTCTNQCLRRERSYEAESEMCMAKCYDSVWIYTRVGLSELNSFAAENNLNS